MKRLSSSTILLMPDGRAGDAEELGQILIGDFLTGSDTCNHQMSCMRVNVISDLTSETPGTLFTTSSRRSLDSKGFIDPVI